MPSSGIFFTKAEPLTADKKKIEEMKLQAEDITCMSCAGDIEKILQETEGILEASVNYAEDCIHIRYDADSMNRRQAYMAVRKLVPIRKIISES